MMQTTSFFFCCRPFKDVVTESTFTVFPNNFDEAETSFAELAHVTCDPVGMAWSVDNSTIFLSDAHSRNVTKCSYGMEYIPGVQKEMDATNCSTLVHLSDTGMAPEARPRGLAIDQDNHLWLAVEQNEGQGAILEINTDTGAVVSTIGNLAKSWNIHIKGTPHQPSIVHVLNFVIIRGVVSFILVTGV